MKDYTKVLLVEENPLTQLQNNVLLKQFGCIVDIAKNGKQALQKSKGKYDIIFMNIGLPDISGIQVTKTIRNHESKKEHVPIVAISAIDEQRYFDECIASGMDTALAKPLTLAKIKETLGLLSPVRL
ncbi:MAG TPA: response regulator [Gammaproteobacteria bacterium]|nr:response regulator [Gammaproteobacteria bacterium]